MLGAASRNQPPALPPGLDGFAARMDRPPRAHHDAGRAPLRPGSGVCPIRVGRPLPAPDLSSKRGGGWGRVVEDYERGSPIFTNSWRGRVVEDLGPDFQHDLGAEIFKKGVVENKSFPYEAESSKRVSWEFLKIASG